MTWRQFIFPKHSIVLAFAQYVDFKLAPQGKLLVVAGLAGGTLGVASLDIPIYPLFGLLLLLGVFSLLGNFACRPRLRVSIALPDRAVAGQPFDAEAMVENKGRFSAYDVGAGFLRLPRALREYDAKAYTAVLAPGARARLPLHFVPLKRGVYTLPPFRAFSTFPFNLLRGGSARCDAGALLVQPAFSPLNEVTVPASRRYQPGGISLTSNVGESPEYIGNREFRTGDPLKHIDFRSWARLARPAVREYQEEYYSRLALVVDTHVPRLRRGSASGYEDFEAGISLAAAIADALSRGEYLVDIFAVGAEVHVFQAGRHTAHLENILEILACVEPCRFNPFHTVAHAIEPELPRLSSMIAVFLDWDPARRELVQLAEEAGCPVKAVVVRKSAPTQPFEEDGIPHFTPETVRAGGIDSL